MTQSNNPRSGQPSPGAQATAGARSDNIARLAPQVAALFPPGVVAAELRGEGDPALLSVGERQGVERFVPKRLKEFAAGRTCARLALQELGISGFSLLPAPDRRPLWPPGVTGSITHTEGYCVAVVARCSQIRSLGIDSEGIEAVHEELWPHICGAAELAWLKQLRPERRQACAALIFAAKECFYKCQYPVTGEWLDFSAVAIELADRQGKSGQLRVIPQREIQLQAATAFPMPGHFRFHERWVTAAVAFI